MDYLQKLPSFQEIILEYPLADSDLSRKYTFDKTIENILKSRDSRFLLIIGPCSADRQDSVLEYVENLSVIQKYVSDKIVIIPRVYSSKPRTLGKGYKGMIHQPDLNKDEDLYKGIGAVRLLLKNAIETSGLFPADELLYPDLAGYFGDLLSYVAIGARSVEDQQHRLIASGLSVPVGMKNPISGDVNIMMNSIFAAQQPHHFIFNGWEVISNGNPLAHCILRGATGTNGESIPNYDKQSLLKTYATYSQRNLENVSIIVDCNHSNSGKNYLAQIDIAKDVLSSKKNCPELSTSVKGLMIESYLKDGCQDFWGKEYGKSITDPCLGWDKTKQLIEDIYQIL